MKMLTKEEIVKKEDTGIEEVEVPQWGGSVGIKIMRGSERDDFDQVLYDRSDGNKIKSVKGIKVLLLSKTLCDSEGNLLFPTNEDRKELRNKSAAVIEKLFEKSSILNGIGPEEVKKLGKK